MVLEADWTAVCETDEEAVEETVAVAVEVAVVITVEAVVAVPVGVVAFEEYKETTEVSMIRLVGYMCVAPLFP